MNEDVIFSLASHTNFEHLTSRCVSFNFRFVRASSNFARDRKRKNVVFVHFIAVLLLSCVLSVFLPFLLYLVSSREFIAVFFPLIQSVSSAVSELVRLLPFAIVFYSNASLSM